MMTMIIIILPEIKEAMFLLPLTTCRIAPVPPVSLRASVFFLRAEGFHCESGCTRAECLKRLRTKGLTRCRLSRWKGATASDRDRHHAGEEPPRSHRAEAAASFSLQRTFPERFGVSSHSLFPSVGAAHPAGTTTPPVLQL